MREQDGAPAGLRVEALEDVLEEGVVGPSLWRRAEDIAAHGSFRHASRFQVLMEYGGLATTTSNVIRRSRSMKAGSLRTLPTASATTPSDTPARPRRRSPNHPHRRPHRAFDESSSSCRAAPADPMARLRKRAAPISDLASIASVYLWSASCAAHALVEDQRLRRFLMRADSSTAGRETGPCRHPSSGFPPGARSPGLPNVRPWSDCLPYRRRQED